MISVIIATKNGEKYIGKAIQSALNQTYALDPATASDFELLVINDGSTDTTAQVVEQFQQKDSRIRLISLEKNIGPGLARNRGVEESHGTYLAFLDDDDLWLSKDKLTLQKKFLDEHADVTFVGSTHVHIFNEEGKELFIHINLSSEKELRNNMLKRNSFATSSVMARKSAVQAVGGFKAMYLAEEYDLWLRLGQTSTLANLDNCDIAYTKRKSSTFHSQEKGMYVNVLHLVQEYKHAYPGYIIGLLRAYGRILIVTLKNLF